MASMRDYVCCHPEGAQRPKDPTGISVVTLGSFGLRPQDDSETNLILSRRRCTSVPTGFNRFHGLGTLKRDPLSGAQVGLAGARNGARDTHIRARGGEVHIARSER